MTTPLGTSFFTDKTAVTQAIVRLLGMTVKTLIVEFDQGKFEEFLSSGSASPKAMRHYRKVSSETCSRISLEITPKVAYTTAYNARGATSQEVLKTYRASHAACVNISQETHKAKALVHDHIDSEGQFRRPPHLQHMQFQVVGVPNNP